MGPIVNGFEKSIVTLKIRSCTVNQQRRPAFEYRPVEKRIIIPKSAGLIELPLDDQKVRIFYI